jgi:hypothetical protein
MTIIPTIPETDQPHGPLFCYRCAESHVDPPGCRREFHPAPQPLDPPGLACDVLAGIRADLGITLAPELAEWQPWEADLVRAVADRLTGFADAADYLRTHRDVS